MSEISGEDVEAAARAMHEQTVARHGADEDLMSWDFVPDWVRAVVVAKARAALTAAEPVMRAAIVEEVAVAIEAGVLLSHPSREYRDGHAHAAHIARSLATEATR